jgi:hypothetical protein
VGERLASRQLPAARPLELLTEAADRLDGVRRGELGPGDRLLVATRNSIYALTARADGRFEARGGWFERAGKSPAETGLFLEFDDGTRTTRIQRVRLLREPAAG